MSSLRHDPSHCPPLTQGSAQGDREGFLSIIIPAKDEAAGLPQLIGEIASAFRPLLARPTGQGHRLESYEILVIDDGSTDGTPAVLHGLSQEFPELRPIVLQRNVGQSAATLAGFRVARGAWVAILDADLQNDPADLARLWDLLPGHDVVLGWREKREDVWSKRVISRWANRVRNAVLGQSIRDTGCSVRIFPREIALRLPMFHGAHRFFGPLLIREGCSVLQAPVRHRPRPHGTSHYNFRNRSLKVVADLFGVAWLMRRPIGYRIDSSQGLPRGKGTSTQASPHLDLDRTRSAKSTPASAVGQET